jgi:oligopeptide transport system substrate-binding protein
MRQPLPLVVLFLLVALALLGGCGKRETPVEAGIRTGTLLVGNQNEPASLDPHLLNAYTDMRIAMAVFEGLTVLDEKTATALPGAAERWEVSADGLTYTFHLRPTGKWSNGERVTAGDFAYAFRRLLTPALGATYAYMLWPIKNAEAFNTGKLTDFSAVGIQVVDDLTLRLTLERPTPYLPALATHSTWFPVPRGTVERFGRMDARDTVWTRPGNLVGNGPYVLAEWKPNSHVTVTRNVHYWGNADNRIERVQFFPIEKADAEERSFRAGQLHVTASLPASKIPVYRRQSPELLRIEPELSTLYFNFNVTKPPLDNPKVRRALALAVDRAAISARIYEGASQPAPTLVPPGCAGYTPPPGQRHDFAAARAQLAEAGFPEGRGLPVLPFQVGNDDKGPRIAEAIQAMWLKELGVKVTIEQLEQKTLFQNQQSLTHMVGALGWHADYADPYTFLEIFRGGNGNNWSGWASKDYDALLDEAGRTVDPARRFALLQRAEAILLEEAPLITVVFRARTFALHPAVKNWQPAPLGLNRYQVLRLEP